MPQVINTNIASLNSQRSLNASQNSLNSAIQRLSSGLRINSAKDDAAGMAVSQKMTAQVKSMNQAVRNDNDGNSMIQTAEGGMQESQTIMLRMRELAVQASSDTISNTERGYINTELQQLLTESNAIADRTKFNGQSSLTGALTTTLGGATATDLVVGDTLATTQTAMVTAIDVSSAKAGDTYTFSDAGGGQLTLTRGSDGAAQTITAGALGANASGTLDFTNIGVKVTLQATASGKAAADIVTDLTAVANDTIVTTGSGSATLQIGADSTAGNTLAMSFKNTKIDTANTDVTSGAIDGISPGVQNLTLKAGTTGSVSVGVVGAS